MTSTDKNYNLTILITASHIRTHPSIRMICETISSLKNITNMNQCHVILAHDYSSKKSYANYLDNLKNYLKKENLNNITIAERNSHGHLVGNIRNAITYVQTEWILVMQHDFPFIREFDIDKILDDMKSNPDMKHVKFPPGTIRSPDGPTGTWDRKNKLYGKQVYGEHYTYTRTAAWCDYNHICRTSYYTDLVLKECPDGVPMENILNPSCNESNHDKYGTYIFGGIGAPAYLHHLDGSKTLKSKKLDHIYRGIKNIETKIRKYLKRKNPL